MLKNLQMLAKITATYSSQNLEYVAVLLYYKIYIEEKSLEEKEKECFVFGQKSGRTLIL